MVLVEPGKDIESQVEKLMAPYNENNEVEEYETECWCVGRKAQQFAEKETNKKLGTIKKHRKEFKKIIRDVAKKEGWEGRYTSCSFGLPTGADNWPDKKKELWVKIDKIVDKLWKERIDIRNKLEQELCDNHPLRDKPDSTCGFYTQEDIDRDSELQEKGIKVGDRYLDESGCAGRGKVMSTYNQASKWDWWVIGGRWQGHLLLDYDPCEDPKNMIKCDLCNGTGDRPKWVIYKEEKKGKKIRTFKDKWAKDCNGCNGCHGKGKHLTFTLAPVRNDFPIKDLLERKDKSSLIPYAIVTPGDGWISRGRMGWFGMSADDKEGDKWEKEVLNILNKYKDLNAVTVDCHI